MKEPTSPAQAVHAADRDTVERVLRGDTDVFAELIERHQSPVYTHVLRMVRCPEDALDLTQEVFVKAFKHLAQYNPHWPFRNWLMTIATNTTINFLRKRRLETVSLEDVAEPAAEPAPTTPHDVEPVLAAALARLPDKAREMVNLRYQEGLTLAQISSVLGESLSNVKVTLHRARRFLRAELEGVL